MGDPTIPRSPRNGRASMATWGYFVQRSETVVELRDRGNNSWPLDQVTIHHGGWGFDDEGCVKLPRPSVFNDAGQETVLGDRVLILFLEASRKRVVVIPGFRRISATAADFLPYNHFAPSAADPNRWAARVQPKTSTGAPIGSVDLEAGYDQKAAARASVGPPNGGGPRTFVALDDADGSVQAGTKDGAALRLAKGQCALVTAEGHVLLLDGDNGIQLAWAKGGPGGPADPAVVLKDGLAQILATLTQIVGRLELTNGVEPALSPLALAGTPTAGFFFDLSVTMTAIGLLGVFPATELGAKLAIAAATPGTYPGYSSDVAKSTG